MTRAVTFIVPRGIDDPVHVSGGNVYDRRVRDGLARSGWRVRTIEAQTASFDDVPDGELVLVDGLVAAASAPEIERARERVRIVVLAHMVAAAFPRADRAVVDGERRAVRAARAIISTSAWTAGLLGRDDVRVATPGADPAPLATGTPSGRSLLCVGVVAWHKGQDVLVDALARTGGACTLAGSTAHDPAFADAVHERAREAGVEIDVAGVCTGPYLDRLYDGTDLLVAPSRVESYGMVVAEAHARGIPVIASRVGGIPEAVDPDAALLVPPDDAGALAEALGRWMTDPGLRRELTDAARRARPRRPGWDATVARVSDALAEVD